MSTISMDSIFYCLPLLLRTSRYLRRRIAPAMAAESVATNTNNLDTLSKPAFLQSQVFSRPSRIRLVLQRKSTMAKDRQFTAYDLDRRNRHKLPSPPVMINRHRIVKSEWEDAVAKKRGIRRTRNREVRPPSVAQILRAHPNAVCLQCGQETNEVRLNLASIKLSYLMQWILTVLSLSVLESNATVNSSKTTFQSILLNSEDLVLLDIARTRKPKRPNQRRTVGWRIYWRIATSRARARFYVQVHDTWKMCLGLEGGWQLDAVYQFTLQTEFGLCSRSCWTAPCYLV